MATRVSIDAAGRVVIPKAVRERLHLTPGRMLDLDVDDDGVVLRPVSEAESSLAWRDGVLMAVGECVGPIPTVADVRQNRSRSIWRAGND